MCGGLGWGAEGVGDWVKWRNRRVGVGVAVGGGIVRVCSIL